MPTFAYRGNESFIAEVEPRLIAAGFTREGEVEAADTVITYHISTSWLEDLYFGDDGLVQNMPAGSALIDLSPTTPNFAKDVYALAAVHDLNFVEAPLVVKNMVSESGFARDNLSCFVAGEDKAIAAAKSLLDAIFSQTEKTGESGSAQLARAALSLQRIANLISAIEADALCRAARRSVSGIGKEAPVAPVAPAITQEAQEILQAAADSRFSGSFTCEMLYGELVSAIMAADDYELIMPQAEAASHLLELVAVIGGSDMSPAALALAYAGEEECTQAGLDWARAAQLYGTAIEDDDEDGLGGHEDFDYPDDIYGDDSQVGFNYSAN